MREIVTTVEKKERAIIVPLDTLEGNLKAKKVVRDTRINTDKGMAVLFWKFDIVF